MKEPAGAERQSNRERRLEDELHSIQSWPESLITPFCTANRDRPLIIDPVLVYSSFLGGNGNDGAYDVAVEEVERLKG